MVKAMKMKRAKKALSVGNIVLMCVLLIGIGRCKKVAVPDGIIRVNNQCGLRIDFFLDGVYQFFVDYEEEKSVEELADGTYELLAKRSGTGEFVDSEILDVWFNRIYTWQVVSSAKVKIINQYGETLKIYGEGEYIGDVADQQELILFQAPYGDRNLEVRTLEDVVVATTTIAIYEDIEYTWTITR